MIRSGLIQLAILCTAAPAAAQIVLPEPLAVEIPVPGATTINADEPPLSELLGSASSAQGPVSHDQQGLDLPLGPTLVTWTDGVSNRSEFVYVYPFGQTPVGSTDYERATSGNGATNVVRDPAGRLHVAWLDSGRAEDRVLYRRGTQDPETGLITWLTPALRISEPANDVFNSMVAVAVSESYVHFVWYGGGDTTYYRRLRLADDGFDPVRSTGASGALSDNGPSLAVRGDDEVHVVTPANGGSGGRYALSSDGGLGWTVETIPRPSSGESMKATAIAVDRHGNAHVVFPWRVRSSTPRFWELRYVRRTTGGVWVDAHYVLGQFPEWLDPLADADPSNNGWHILSDWLDIAVDRNDNLHVAWHGTVNTHVFANDEAFYIRRPSTAPGAWSPTWEPYVPLWPAAAGFSFAPSLTVAEGSRLALPIVFYDTSTTELFDSNFKKMRDGAWDGQPAIPLTTMAADGHGLSSWFPCAAPELYREPGGRIWLDVVATDWPAEASADMIIVHQRRDVTDLLQNNPYLFVGRDRLSWTPLPGATGYDVVRGDLEILRSSGGDFTAATETCLVEDTALRELDHTATPAAGQGFWFLTRGIDGGGGLTYDSGATGQVGSRDAEIDLAPGACS